MATYYVDDGGSATDPYDTWAKAATSLSALDDAKTLASGDIIYIGHDHVCAYAHVGNRIIVGPTTDAPCIIISATQGSSPPTYQKSSTDQIDTTEGAYSLTFDGAFAIYGVRIKSGANITFDYNSVETCLARDVTAAPAANGTVNSGTAGNGRGVFYDLTVDLTADGTTNRSAVAMNFSQGVNEIHGLTLVNPGYRTGFFFQTGESGRLLVEGADLSGIDFATKACELVGVSGSGGEVQFQNCILNSTFSHHTTSLQRGRMNYTFVNCQSANSAWSTAHYDQTGSAVATTSVYRNSGASVDGSAHSWLITTNSKCHEHLPYYAPWVYGVVSSTGSKTFTQYVTHETVPAADYTNAELWLEVQFLGTSTEAIYESATDQRSASGTTATDITATAAAQTDADGDGSWTGVTGTYEQKLAVTATVNVAGLYRARVVCAYPSVTNLYVDPKVTVT